MAQKWDMETDIVVVGFGGAGAAAALEAHDMGSAVQICEKAPRHLPGGNTGCCAGFMSVPSSLSGGIEYYQALAFGTVTDEELVRTMAKEIIEVPAWLESMGVPTFIAERQMPGTFPALPGSTIDRIGVVGGGHTAFKVLADEVESRGINVMYETPATRLVQNPLTMEIIGVIADQQGSAIQVKARKGVVLTCGGYQNNPEMQGYFNYPGLRFYPWGTPYNTGDGILMASVVGAKLWHFASLEVSSLAIKAPSELFGSSAALPYLPVGGSYIFVNKFGNRFMEETRRMGHYKGDVEVCRFDHETAEYPNIPPYLVFDETFRKQGPLVPEQPLPPQTATWLTVHDLYRWSHDNSREIDRGWIVKGETLEDLARNMGLDAKSLAETVAKYNEYCTTGADLEFHRDPESLVPIETPPFYGTELCLNVINTQGGPVHDAKSQVIGIDNEPIPGLYAAGELGSFFGHLYEGGSNFPEAFAFGRIAGKNAAAQAPWE